MNNNPNRRRNGKVRQMGATFKTTSVAVLVALGLSLTAWAAEASKPESPPDLDKLVEQPVDLSPWAYAWRADREVQEKPEAYFIPRRLELLDKVYRTFWSKLTKGEQELRENRKNYQIYKDALLPAPKGRLLSASLWLALVPAQRIELRWPEGSAVPPVEAIEVRVYPLPTGGWFGLVRDEVLPAPAVSADGRTLTYNNQQTEGNAKEKPIFEGTDMVAVFFDPAKAPADAKYGCPSIHLYLPAAKWSTLDVEIEWGFQAGAEQAVFDGRIEAYGGYVKSVKPLPEDKGTTMTGADAWKSAPVAGSARRGIVVTLLHLKRFFADRIHPLDTRITLWTKGGNLTFMPNDVNTGPVLVPSLDMFVAKAGANTTARQFAAELAAKNLKTIPQMIREHAEVASWEQLMRRVRFDPALTNLPPFQPFQEEVPATAMRVQLPDERWNDAWRRSSWQLSKGKGGYWNLALEAARPIHAMDLVGLHETSGGRLDYWLKSRGAKANGDFVDGEGSLQYGERLNYDGFHPQTGWLLFALAERYLLSGDKEWFVTNRPRLQAAADWIVRQRKLYLQDMPNREALEAVGLQPPQGLGDKRPYRWAWFLVNDVFSLKGLRRFADALAEFDAPAAEKYQEEVRAYTSDLLRAVEREIAWSPVRPARDGAFHRWIPSSLYARGTMASHMVGDYQLLDIEMGSLPLADIGGVLDPCDRRVADHLNLVEDQRTSHNRAGDDTWFFMKRRSMLLKYSFVGNIHLLRDDVPCFLRHWMVYYAACVSPDGSFDEWGGDKQKTWDSTGLRPYSEGSPYGQKKDLMYTGWFMENFRNLLVMEQDGILWLARATPREWLEQGKKISVRNAPTHFGTVAYEIVSDVDNGKINATVEMPSRKAPKEVVLRFRHPKAAPIKAVTVNGKPWTEFNKDKETITLKGLTGAVSVTAQY